MGKSTNGEVWVLNFSNEKAGDVSTLFCQPMGLHGLRRPLLAGYFPSFYPFTFTPLMPRFPLFSGVHFQQSRQVSRYSVTRDKAKLGASTRLNRLPA